MSAATLELAQSQPARAPERIEVLQAVRAVAALAVLVFHAGHAANKHGGPMPFVGQTDLGIAGVDLFFVLSGFIIPHVTIGRGWTIRAYARARFRRIFLPYWPVGLAMAGMVYGIMPDTTSMFRGWLVSLTLLPIGQPGLNVAWTLQHEIVFYAIFALGLFTGWWRTGLAGWAGVILLFVLTGISAPIGLQPIDAEFVMGIAAWAAWRDGRRKVIGLTSAALILMAIALFAVGEAFAIERAGLIAAAAVFAACLPWLVIAGQAEKIRIPRAMSMLGDASYAIYLTHALPLLLLSEYGPALSWQAILGLAVFAGLAIGLAYHFIVERPLLALMPSVPAEHSKNRLAAQNR